MAVPAGDRVPYLLCRGPGRPCILSLRGYGQRACLIPATNEASATVDWQVFEPEQEEEAAAEALEEI